MQRRHFLSGAATLAAATSIPGAIDARAADVPNVTASNGPWPLRGSESFVIDSEAVGDRLAVGVSEPDAQMLELLGRTAELPPPDLVYVLDGSWALAIAAFIARLQLVDLVKPGFPPLVMVGVDYPEDQPNARTRDYTHTDLATPLQAGELPPEQTIGGVSFYEDMGRNYNSLVSVLNSTPNDRPTFASKMYPGHTHTTILAPAINDALLYLYGPHLPRG